MRLDYVLPKPAARGDDRERNQSHHTPRLLFLSSNFRGAAVT